MKFSKYTFTVMLALAFLTQVALADGIGKLSAPDIAVTTDENTAVDIIVIDENTTQKDDDDDKKKNDKGTKHIVVIDSFTQPSSGTVVQNGDSTLTYAPAEGFVGTDQFTYTLGVEKEKNWKDDDEDDEDEDDDGDNGKGPKATGTITVAVTESEPIPQEGPVEVILSLTSSTGIDISDDAAFRYYQGGWQTVEGTSVILDADTYTFRVNYGGASFDIQQDVSLDQTLEFRTIATTAQLLESDDATPIAGANVRYYAGGWKDFGVTDESGQAVLELLPGEYTVRMQHAGASHDLKQDITQQPLYAFRTIATTA
ncbi:MAG: hypothetical protein KAU50_04185, partial [Candidatus Marinimicrobia bacterium]|nr:hypothetical protein [Candidatus Neomarinimicrobiota bacterium]